MRYVIIFLLALPFAGRAQSLVLNSLNKKVDVLGYAVTNDTLKAVNYDSLQNKSRREGACNFYIENISGYLIDIWTDEIYLGRLFPYSGIVKFDVSKTFWTHWRAKTVSGKLMWNGDSYCNDSRVFCLLLKR